MPLDGDELYFYNEEKIIDDNNITKTLRPIVSKKLDQFGGMTY